MPAPVSAVNTNTTCGHGLCNKCANMLNVKEQTEIISVGCLCGGANDINYSQFVRAVQIFMGQLIFHGGAKCKRKCYIKKKE